MTETARLTTPILKQAPATAARRPGLLNFWRRRSTPAVNLSLLVLAGLTLAVLLAEQFSPHSPTAINLRRRLAPPAFIEGGNWEHPLGTDATGRDILSRVLHGGRVSLLVGGIATALGLALGTALGLISGFARGWVDEVIMYLVDVQLSLPFILLAVAVALVLGNSLGVLIGLAAISTWPFFARIVRGVVLSLREREFVIASRAVGAGGAHIIREHLLPNILAPVLVIATLSVGRVILLESGLSFIGVGIRPPEPSWGNMISEGRDYLAREWWISTMPGIALMLLTIAVGTIGDWLRDLSDVTLG